MRPRVPQSVGTDPPSPAALSAPETQALQGSRPLAAGRLRGWPLTRQQLRALLLKRFLLACRSRRGLFAQVRGPVGVRGRGPGAGDCVGTRAPGLCSGHQPRGLRSVRALSTFTERPGEPRAVLERERGGDQQPGGWWGHLTGLSLRSCCPPSSWAWRCCSASSCRPSDTTQLCSSGPACTAPRCPSSGGYGVGKGRQAGGPGAGLTLSRTHSEDAPGTSDQARLLAMLLEEAGLGEGAHRQDGSAR